MDQKVELLSKVPLLAGLSRKDLEQVAQLSDEVDLPAGRVLMKQGSYGDEFYVIISGSVRVERDGQVLRELGAGDFLGELALLGNIARTATATCVDDGRFLVLGHREFNSMLAAYPDIQKIVLKTVAQRMVRLEPDQPH
jgi:CRP/FNR family transcriptional regulator, cyclic AMP receptor protein